MQAVVEHLGPVDILVNSAGLRCGGKVHEIAEEAWDLCFDVNVKGTFLLCKAVVPIMLERQQGQIINIASLSAWIRGSEVRRIGVWREQIRRARVQPLPGRRAAGVQHQGLLPQPRQRPTATFAASRRAPRTG